MGVLEAILIILALKIPIVGLISFVYWVMKEPETEGPSERKVRAMPPRLPDLGDRRPRRRGPARWRRPAAAEPAPRPAPEPLLHAKALRHLFLARLRRPLVGPLLARRQRHPFLVEPLVGDLFEQVADQVQPGRALVVGLDHEPR